MRLRWDYLLVLEILLQGDAARHDGCELDVVHKICAGVFGQVFFDNFASKKSNSSDKASDGCSVDDRLHELVVRHGEVYLGFSFFWRRNHNRCSDSCRMGRCRQLDIFCCCRCFQRKKRGIEVEMEVEVEVEMEMTVEMEVVVR